MTDETPVSVGDPLVSADQDKDDRLAEKDTEDKRAAAAYDSPAYAKGPQDVPAPGADAETLMRNRKHVDAQSVSPAAVRAAEARAAEAKASARSVDDDGSADDDPPATPKASTVAGPSGRKTPPKTTS